MSDPNVKDSRHVSRWMRLCCWLDTHPRTGWYFTALLIFNTIANIIELF